MLETLDLSLRLSKNQYRADKRLMQQRLHRLQRACWENKVATIVVFEGWDAAGKGTAINKLSQRLEPRGFSLWAIQEPRTTELQLPWMWRFWVKVPNWGELAIFDRSWYGRVVVERVEGLISDRQRRKAYGDIVSFERGLADDRYLVVKFFLHISKEQQRERFEKLESDPATAWHVEPEDWEHHKQYDDYLVATEEMLERTETEWGPWTLVEATDKYWARVKIFDTLIGRMEEGLARHGCLVPEDDIPAEVIDENGADNGDD